jgi:putative flippase GtrA
LKKEGKEVIRYLFTGVCTTLLNLGTFYVLTNVLNIHYLISNTIAWIVGVVFAYVTNRTFVFQSKSKNKKDVLREIISFFLARVLSLGVDQVLIFIMIEFSPIGSTIAKLISNVVVVAINYLLGKFIIFKQ